MMLKRMWRHHINWIYLAIKNKCADFEFNTLPSLPPLSPEYSIVCFVQDDKTGIKFGRDVLVAPDVRNSRFTIVPVGNRVECHDHDFICYKITIFVTLKMNIGKTLDESM